MHNHRKAVITMFKKCYLVKRHMPASGTDVWCFTTTHQQPVSVLGETGGSFSFSSWSPGQSATSNKRYTIFCNDMTDELAAQYIAHNADSNVFYMGLPTSDTEPATIITASEYTSSDVDDTQADEQPVAE